jgi:hypothetical protein
MISYSLRDDLDIQRRIDAAGKAMGALNGFFKQPQVKNLHNTINLHGHPH